MNNLGSFADLMQKAVEDKQRRIAEETSRRNLEVVPLLSELFTAVKKAKLKKESPSIKPSAELPPKTSEDVIAELIVDTEEQAKTILAKVAPDEQEKRFLALFKRLQDDFQTLKQHVERKTSSYSGGGTSGSGEVRILRMDDVDTKNLADGFTMVWDESSKKFVFAAPPVGGGGGGGVPVGPKTTTLRQIATSNGATFVPISLTQMMINGGFELYVNGLKQSKTEYTVDYPGINIKASVNILIGDVIEFISSSTSLAWNTTYRTLAILDGSMVLDLTLTQIQKDNGYELFINSLQQSRDFYVVSSSGINISSVLQIKVGDTVDFQYTQ